MPEVEKYKFNNISIKDLLKKEVVEELEKGGFNIFPVSLVFINEEGEAKKKIVCPIVVSHQNNKEVQDKVIHLDCPNNKMLELFTRLLEKLGGK
jgi:hypothetical protein